MMRTAALLLLSVAVLAGCGRKMPNEADENSGIRMANKYHDDLQNLSPGRQRLAMLRALRDGGIRQSNCRNVANAGYQEEYKNMRMWVAECGNDSRSYAVFIAPNGDVQVRNCADAGTLSLPRCEGLPPPAEDPTMPQVLGEETK
jgi:hypothetical protein